MSVPIELAANCMGLPLEKIQPPCVFGMDVRFGSYDLVIADLPVSTIARQRVVRPVFYGKVTDEREAWYVIRQYRCRWGVADSRPETTIIDRLQKQAAEKNVEVWRAAYNTNPTEVKLTLNAKERIVRLDRTMALDQVQHEFQMQTRLVLPQNYAQIGHGAFSGEMTASSKVAREWHGRPWWFWESGGDDHAMHAMALLLVAVELSGLRRGYGVSVIVPGIVEGSIERNLTAEENKQRDADPALFKWRRQIADDDGGQEMVSVAR
jgi:hypothetical protein